MFEFLLEALRMLTHPATLGFIFLGNLTGLVFGLLPGLGGAAALAVLLPLTYGMDPMTAMFFLSAVMGAVPFGGSISAILLNIPGTPVNMATCLDGHPMARKGEAGKALEIAAAASGFGALFGAFFLVLILPLVRKVIFLFGPPEFFILFLFGLATVSLASKGGFLKGLAASGVGVLLSFVGYNSVFGDLRFTFGSEYLWDGFPLIPLMVGIFAVGELIRSNLSGGMVAAKTEPGKGRLFEGVKEVFHQKKNLLRSSMIGTLIGILPGVGGTVASFAAYIAAKKKSKNPASFGTGNSEGIVATESANNAKDGGALLPTIGLGIPGSVQMAVLLGAFVLHGLTPGPLLLRERLDIVLALLFGLIISSLLASSFGLLSARLLSKVTHLEIRFVTPLVLSFCLVGAYSIRENIWDILATLLFGVIGYGMTRYGYSPICLVIGFILGGLAERSFHQSLMMSYGSPDIFVKRPVSLMLILLFVSVFISPFFRRRAGGNSQK